MPSSAVQSAFITTGGAYSKKDIKPLWKEKCEHDGVHFPEPYVPVGIRANRRRKEALPPDVEEFVVMYANLLSKGHPMARSPAFRASFMKDLLSMFRVNDDVATYIDWPLVTEQIIGGTMKNTGGKRREQQRQPSFANVDGELLPVTRNVVDRPGIFIGRNPEHPLNGRIRRRISTRDVVLNLSEAAPVPKPPAHAGGAWKAVTHNPLVTWLARWEDPLSGVQKYVYLDGVAALKQHHEKRKFEMARRYRAERDAVRSSMLAAVRYLVLCKDDNSLEAMASVVALLIDEFGIRAGNDTPQQQQPNSSEVVGAASLRAEHLQLLSPGNRVRLRFVGKDHVPFDRTQTVPRALWEALSSLRKERCATVEGERTALFPRVSPDTVNQYLDGLLSGLTCKVMRTAKGSALVNDRLSRISAVSGRAFPSSCILQVAMWEVAWLMNHKKAVTPLPRDAPVSERRKVDKESRTHADEEAAFVREVATFWKKATAGGDADDKAAKEAWGSMRERARRLRLSPQTAKVNYVDPRIIVAYCRRHGSPIQKNFSMKQLERFGWALNAPPTFSF